MKASLLHIALLVPLVFSLSAANAQEENGPMDTLLKSWVTKAEQLNRKSKSFPREKLDLMVKLLDEARPSVIPAHFRHARDMQKEPEFYSTLLQALVYKGVREQNWSNLVELLTFQFPPYVGNFPTEFFLAQSNAPKAIEVLVKSYRGATNLAAKRLILSSLIGAFHTLRGLDPEDDERFVARCDHWYMENKDKVRLNPDYPRLVGAPIVLSGEKQLDLFVPN
jgi:hypothetical protein